MRLFREPPLQLGEMREDVLQNIKEWQFRRRRGGEGGRGGEGDIPFFARLTILSATFLNSLALATVVSIRSCFIKEVTIFLKVCEARPKLITVSYLGCLFKQYLSIAHRCSEPRPSFLKQTYYHQCKIHERAHYNSTCGPAA